MIRFLHTGDWQLGMTRHFFSEGVQERFSQSRFDAIRELGRIAGEEDCAFMIVCGDVFESNLVDRKTVSRALEALREVPVPVYLLPANHDPLDASSIYRSSAFLEKKPPEIHVIVDSNPFQVTNGFEIVGIPWMSKHPMKDLVAPVLQNLEPVTDKVRICVAHGIVDSLSPDPDNPELISLQTVEEAISQGRIQYMALGDRHSLAGIGDSGRVWYAGTPEPTDYREVESGFALIAEINEENVVMKEVEVGRWKFIERKDIHLNTKEDIEALRSWLDDLENKERTVLKLRFIGSVSLLLHRELIDLLDHAGELFAAVETREEDLVVVPEDTDFSDLGFSGFAGSTVERLREMADQSDSSSSASRDALALMIRLAGRES